MKELPLDACKGFLHRHRFGVIALADGGRAYALPLFYAYDGRRLYFQSHPGEKDAYMAGCSEASFVVAEFKDDDEWRSVQATGPVDKVTLSDDAEAALNAMAKNPFPPEFGNGPDGTPLRSSRKMYLWMMVPTKLTGRTSSLHR